MLTTIAILDRLKAWKNWSDYRIAKQLEVSQQTISGYRNRGRVMNDETAEKAADLLGLPREFILANIHAERALNSPAFQTLEHILEMIEEAQREEIEAGILANDPEVKKSA